MRTLIVDDEKRARDTIRNLLGLYCPTVEVAGEADNIHTASELIGRLKPDLLFLDIQMPGGSGFDLAELVRFTGVKIIFITAYEQYAIRAFRISALDYILKPVNPDDLVAAVDRAQKSMESEHLSQRLSVFISNMDDLKKESKRIVLKTSEAIHIVNIRDIIRCEADGNYTRFYLVNGKNILVSNTLKDYNDLLTGYSFFRVHQSHLANLEHAESFDKKDGGFLVMKDHSRIPVAIRKKEGLLRLLENI